MSDVISEVESVEGVRYTTFSGSELRVVFDHHAPLSAIAEVSEHLKQEGRIGATQEHLPYLEVAAGTSSVLAPKEQD